MNVKALFDVISNINSVLHWPLVLLLRLGGGRCGAGPVVTWTCYIYLDLDLAPATTGPTLS